MHNLGNRKPTSRWFSADCSVYRYCSHALSHQSVFILPSTSTAMTHSRHIVSHLGSGHVVEGRRRKRRDGTTAFWHSLHRTCCGDFTNRGSGRHDAGVGRDVDTLHVVAAAMWECRAAVWWKLWRWTPVSARHHAVVREVFIRQRQRLLKRTALEMGMQIVDKLIVA